jgi:hypothetical protein
VCSGRLAFMAPKKKTKKTKPAASRRKATASKSTRTRKATPKKTGKKKLTKKKPAQKKAPAKKKMATRTKIAMAGKAAPKQARGNSLSKDAPFPVRRPTPKVSGQQSGDLQGLSDVERADSESVDELLEEGNSFEAGVVEGVERADDSDEGEVRTREVPEDDVPEEYLDKD